MMARARVALLLVLVCIAGVSAVSPASRLNRRAAAKLTAVSPKLIAQLYAPRELDELKAEVDAGTIFKNTSVMIAWQAAANTTQTVKEIHALAGGEAGTTPARLWVFNAASWSGFTAWNRTLKASDRSTYATVNDATLMVTWSVPLRASDEPSEDQCTRYASAMASNDLAAGMVVASEFYDQEIDINLHSSAFRSFRLLAARAELLAERFDSSCIGWKFFSYYDSTLASESPVFSD